MNRFILLGARRVAFFLPILALVCLVTLLLSLNSQFKLLEGDKLWSVCLAILGGGAICAVFLTEILYIGWEKSSLRAVLYKRSPSVSSDVSVFLANQSRLARLLAIPLTFGITFISFDTIRRYLMYITYFDCGLSDIALLPQFSIALILYTFFDYWAHRLDHSPALWPLHRFHHAAQEFCICTATRVHPCSLTNFFMVNAPLILLGISPSVFVAINIVVAYIRFLIHSKIPGQWGWFGRWVLHSADSHRKHHILDENQTGKNFALVPIWDRLFGTWSPACCTETPIGVEFVYRHGAWFLPDLLRDYRDWLANVHAILKRQKRRMFLSRTYEI